MSDVLVNTFFVLSFYISHFSLPDTNCIRNIFCFCFICLFCLFFIKFHDNQMLHNYIDILFYNTINVFVREKKECFSWFMNLDLLLKLCWILLILLVENIEFVSYVNTIFQRLCLTMFSRLFFVIYLFSFLIFMKLRNNSHRPD